jgi:hypothetical protein
MPDASNQMAELAISVIIVQRAVHGQVAGGLAVLRNRVLFARS